MSGYLKSIHLNVTRVNILLKCYLQLYGIPTFADRLCSLYITLTMLIWSKNLLREKGLDPIFDMQSDFYFLIYDIEMFLGIIIDFSESLPACIMTI